jgi:cytochrome P450
MKGGRRPARRVDGPEEERKSRVAEAYNPFEADDPERIFPRLQQLRADADPIVAIGEGMHYVTRHAVARDVLRDTVHFSNAEGFRAPGITVPPEDRMLGEMDAPQHPRVRRVVMTALNPSAIRAEEEFVRTTARRLLDALLVPGPVDLVPAFTRPLPNDATVHLLGFPMEDSARIAVWSTEVMESEWPAMNRTDRGEGMRGAFPEYTSYVDAFIRNVRAGLADGTADDTVVARLITTTVDDEPLSDRQVRALVFNLLLGGLTTTAQLLGNMIYELLARGSVDQLANGSEDERSTYLEECLRMYPPVMFIPRGCTKDVEIAGTTVRAGERVIVGTACANRDELLFDESEHFVDDRQDADRHLTFGFGAHACAGAAMARSVGRIALEEFLAFAGPRHAELPSGFRYENVPTFFEYGPRTLPVTFDRPR